MRDDLLLRFLHPPVERQRARGRCPLIWRPGAIQGAVAHLPLEVAQDRAAMIVGASMEFRSDTAVSGFLSRAPELKRVGEDVLVMVAQLGQKRFRREEDGSYALVGTDFVELVMLGDRAESAAAAFDKGDDVIAVGEFKTRVFEQNGRGVERIQFRAIKLLFDTTYSRYAVVRTPRPAPNARSEMNLRGETPTPAARTAGRVPSRLWQVAGA